MEHRPWLGVEVGTLWDHHITRLGGTHGGRRLCSVLQASALEAAESRGRTDNSGMKEQAGLLRLDLAELRRRLEELGR
jgi:hypothetical protein